MKKIKLPKSLLPIIAILIIVAAVLALSGTVGYFVYKLDSFADPFGGVTFYGKLVAAIAALFVALIGFMGVHEWLSR